MTKFRNTARTGAAVCIALFIGACGGGGGDDSGGGTVPPPPVPKSYSVQLVDASLEDTATGLAVDPSGLPINGATAQRD